MKPLKTLLVLLWISLGILYPIRIANACGIIYKPYHEYNFIDKTIVTDDKSPFIPYTLSMKHYLQSTQEIKVSQQEANTLEWREKFCKYADLEEVHQVIYDTDLAELEALEAATTSKFRSLPPSLMDNDFAQQIIRNKCSEVAKYLVFAKACEPHVITDRDWETPYRDIDAMMTLLDRGKNEFARTKSSYIKLRYAYQILRLAHYSKSYQLTLDLWKELEPQIGGAESILTYWIKGHIAGAMYGLGNYVQASYLYSVIFRHSPSKRERAFRSFLIKTDADWETCLLFCQSDDERATLYIMRAMEADAKVVEEMKHIYELEPYAPELDGLLTREIIRLEDFFLGADFNAGIQAKQKVEAKEFEIAEKKLIELKNFVINCNRQSDKLHSPALWKVAEGFLMYLSNDFYNAKKSYDIASDIVEKDSKLADQLAALQLALMVHSYEKANKTVETKLFRLLNENKTLRTYEDLPMFIFDRMAHLYEQSNQPGKAFLCKYGIKNNRINIEKAVTYLRLNPDMDIINDLISYFDEELNGFEKILLTYEDGTPLKNDILDIKGTLHLAQNEYVEALRTFELVPPSQREAKYFPFYATINDCIHDCNIPDTLPQMSKYQLTEKILELEYQARTDRENSPQYYYMLGIAYYNMTYFGNSYDVIDYFRSGSSWRYLKNGNVFPVSISDAPHGDRNYISIKKALSYFEKARSLSLNSELSARAAYMAAKCELIAFYKNPQSSYTLYRQPDIPANYRNYYDLIIKKYADTAFYQEIIDECKFFKWYASR